MALEQWQSGGLMPDNNDHEATKRLVQSLERELRRNRDLMEEVHSSLARDRDDPPPWLQEILRRMEVVERDLYGNGREGIKYIVTRLQERGSVRLTKRNAEANLSWRVLIAIIAGIATVVAAIVTGAAMIISG